MWIIVDKETTSETRIIIFGQTFYQFHRPSLPKQVIVPPSHPLTGQDFGAKLVLYKCIQFIKLYINLYVLY